MRLVSRLRAPHLLAGSLALGLGSANGLRLAGVPAAAAAVALAAAAVAVRARRALVLAAALAVAGAAWGGLRLGELDRSVLRADVGRAGDVTAVVTGPARTSRFAATMPGEIRSFDGRRLHERVLLETGSGRPPPPGTVVRGLALLKAPRPAAGGFDQGAWLARKGIHVVVHLDRWRAVGSRGGVWGLADRLHAWVGRALARGGAGESRALVAGVVLGEDEGLSEGLRRDLRASGLYHLVAVSGQNVALVAVAALVLAWLAGLPRALGELGALAAIAAYVLVVGAQPSVVRAGIAGSLVSVAWLTARLPDRWHALLVGAVALLAWNPAVLLDPGFELSFAAVVAIFTLVRPIVRALEGYPIPRALAGALAVSTACSLATAPILLLQFGAVPLLSVPANALAGPAVAPLLLVGLAAVAVGPVLPSAAAVLLRLADACAWWIGLVAHAVGSLPLAQIRGPAAVAAVAASAGAAAAYAWRRWRAT